MDNIINTVGIVGVPQILINAQRCIASDSYHIQNDAILLQDSLTKMSKTYNFNRVWEQKDEEFMECMGCAF